MPTIGVALAIPEPWARELQDYRTSIGDATATTIPTHITLLPPTEVVDPDLPGVEGHLAAVAAACRPFRVRLRGTDSFRPVSPVVYVSVAEGGADCAHLAQQVRQGPLGVELAFPYQPHVTVAHDLGDDVLDRALHDLAGFACDFEVAGFHLYRHDAAAGWQPTREFVLSQPD